MEYRDPEPISDAEAIRLIESDPDSDRAAVTLIRFSLHAADDRLVVKAVERAMSSPSPGVRQAGCIAASHRVRLTGELPQAVLDRLREHLNDKDVFGYAADALEDAQIYMGNR